MLPVCWKLGLREVQCLAPRHTENQHQIWEVSCSLPLWPCCPWWDVGSWNQALESPLATQDQSSLCSQTSETKRL